MTVNLGWMREPKKMALRLRRPLTCVCVIRTPGDGGRCGGLGAATIAVASLHVAPHPRPRSETGAAPASQTAYRPS